MGKGAKKWWERSEADEKMISRSVKGNRRDHGFEVDHHGKLDLLMKKKHKCRV